MNEECAMVKCPWRGPEPYEEKDARRFFGRQNELDELLHFVTNQRFTVLTAESGAGKTSLILAGLIPALRISRERAPKEMGLVLYVRNWANRLLKDPVASMIQTLNLEVERLTTLCKDSEPPILLGINQLKKDIENLNKVNPPDENHQDQLESLVDYLGDICSNVESKRLILIIDQTEEFMGSGLSRHDRSSEFKALQVIGTIFKHEPRVKILISLREEYILRLRYLDSMVPALGKRTYILKPMLIKNIRDAVLRSTQNEDSVNIIDNAVDYIIRWVLGTKEELDDDLPVDLLSVQTFLSDIYLKRMEDVDGNKRIDIDIDFLTTYMKDLEEEFEYIRERNPGVELVEGPMIRRIDRVFSLDSNQGSSNIGLAKRIAARMGSILSTPKGFKRFITDGDLIYRAVHEDINMPDMRSLVKEKFKELLHCISRNERTDYDTWRKDLAEYEDCARKAYCLALAGFEAIQKLRESNILKLSGILKLSEQEKYSNFIYSVSHDAYGPSIDAWGEVAQSKVNDTLYSVVDIHGKSMTWKDTVKNIDLVKKNWIGCYFSEITFKKVKFINCNFRGSWFEECSFIGCSFRNCTLSGAGFKSGIWENVTFDNCRAPSLYINEVKWRDVKFISTKDEKESCTNLSNATIKNIILDGNFQLNDCIVHYAQIEAFSKVKDKWNISAHKSDLYGALFCDYDVKDTENFNCYNVNEYINNPPA
ncbi:MAG: pentapeptide repeat-containing protein [Promethearchaeota archaeon]